MGWVACRPTCRAVSDGYPTVRLADDDLAQSGQCVHRVCQDIVADDKRPEDLTPYLEDYGGDPDHVGRMTYYADQFWQEAKGSFINPETEVKMEPQPFGKFYLTGHVDLLAMVALGDPGALLDWKSGYRWWRWEMRLPCWIGNRATAPTPTPSRRPRATPTWPPNDSPPRPCGLRWSGWPTRPFRPGPGRARN